MTCGHGRRRWCVWQGLSQIASFCSPVRPHNPADGSACPLTSFIEGSSREDLPQAGTIPFQFKGLKGFFEAPRLCVASQHLTLESELHPL
jgi:hypothetical protein